MARNFNIAVRLKIPHFSAVINFDRSSKAGGNVEQVVHGKTGYLFDIGDYQFCAMCMIKLTIGDRYVTMGKAAADRVNEIFSTNRMLTSFMNMYDEILKLE